MKKLQKSKKMGAFKALKDYMFPLLPGFKSSIVAPNVTNDFDINPQLISLVANIAYAGDPTEDLYVHLASFKDLCKIVMIKGDNPDAVSMSVFPFSIAGKVKIR